MDLPYIFLDFLANAVRNAILPSIYPIRDHIMKSLITPFLFVFLLALASSAMAAPEVLTIVSDKGKQMKVSLVGKEGHKFIVRRVSDGKKFPIPPKMLSPESKQLLTDKFKALQAMYPEIEAAVSIGKRRASLNGSSYYKRMKVTGKVTLTNKEINRQCPPCSAHLIFIGQDQRDVNHFQVLSNQKFNITPTPKGTLFTAVPFTTSYDSDNKGSSNIGGYKYVGYLLVVLDKKKNVILTKTLHTKIKKAMTMSANLPKTMMKYAEGLVVDKSMVKIPVQPFMLER